MKLPISLDRKTMMMLTAAPLAGLFLVAALFYLLETTAAYHSPLYRAELDGTPRDAALVDLAEWRAQKAEEERQRAELLKSLTTEKMVELGKEIVHGRGLCLNCHKVGVEGLESYGPNLEGVGERAGSRVEGKTDIEYLAQSLWQPEAFIVPDFVPIMTPVNEPPIALQDLDILMVIAYLQSLGGTPTVTPETKLPYGGN